MDDIDRHKRLTNERWARRVERKDRLYNRRRTRPKDELHVVGYRSRILDLFVPFRPFAVRPHVKQSWLTVPVNFSLSENTEATLEFYRRVVNYARSTRVPKILIDHRKVEKLGLAADSVLGVLLKEISWECRGQRGFSMRGYKAQKSEARRMMDRIGCVRAVNDESAHGRDSELDFDLKSKDDLFRYRNSKYISVSGFIADAKARMTKDFADHLDNCLSHAGKRLSEEGRSDLLSYVGEIVTNAEDHSGLNEWLLSGYIDVDEPDLIYRCSIVSFGETFASTFASLPPDSYAFQDVAKYVQVHQKHSLFSPAWRAEDLLAVAALQGDISSKNVDADSTRGQGTVDFIEFFQKISKSCVGHEFDATMTLLTGATRISFDGCYHMLSSGPGQRKVIAFNDENDLTKKPDGQAVHALASEGFPGVVISITAPLALAVVETNHGHQHED